MNLFPAKQWASLELSDNEKIWPDILYIISVQELVTK
jgi:hypothetical protein